jgi:hypothetical protein
MVIHLIRQTGGSAILASIFALSNAFSDVSDLPLTSRIAMWFLVIAPCWISVASVSILLYRRFHLSRFFDQLIVASLCSVALAFPCSYSAQLVWRFFGNVTVTYWEQFAYITSFNLLTSTLVRVFSYPSDRPWASAVTPGGSPTNKHLPAAQPGETLNERLPIAVRGEILSLSGQDHYVEVRTQKGTHLLLSRLADAIALTGDQQGMQVHRSYWVARAGIKKIETRNGKGVITLLDGSEVPISRHKLAKTRRWFDATGS